MEESKTVTSITGIANLEFSQMLGYLVIVFIFIHIFSFSI